VKDAAVKLEEYKTHRLEREAQVLAEVRRGPGTSGELTRRVYGPEVGEDLLVAAEMTMRAHLQKLVDEGKVRVRSKGNTEVFEGSGQEKNNQ
jgi:hypothetical protein